MSITINTNIFRTVPQVNNEGLTLVILANAELAQGLTGAQRINTLQDIEDKIKKPAPEDILRFRALRELNSLSYLVGLGVNTIVFSLKTNTMAELKLLEAETLMVKQLVAPYVLASDVEDDPLFSSNLWEGIIETFEKQNVEILATMKPITPISIVGEDGIEINPLVTTAKANILNNYASGVTKSRLSLFYNFGLVPNVVNVYRDQAYNLTTFNTGTDFPDEYYGVPLDIIVAGRRALNRIANTPWIAVAGETNGTINEYSELFVKINSREKRMIQSIDVNPIITKVGKGQIIVAQNTSVRANEDDKKNPLIRAHNVTMIGALKDKLRDITEGILQLPQSDKTYSGWELKVRDYLNYLAEGGAISNRFAAVTGSRVITPEDRANGVFKAIVQIIPMGVIETAVITLNIYESEETGVTIEEE